MAKQLRDVIWVVEGDITKFFDMVDHSILMALLKRRISCPKTLALCQSALDAGYILDGDTVVTSQGGKGTPQGSVVSPFLSNIYLHELDIYMESIMAGLDASRATQRSVNSSCPFPHGSLDPQKAVDYLRGLTLPSQSLKVRYVRYADDFVIGVSGPYRVAQALRALVAEFLRLHLKLELHMGKSKITAVSQSPVKFLGAEITVRWSPVVLGPSPVMAHKGAISKLGKSSLPLKLDAPVQRLLTRLVADGYLKHNYNGTRLLPLAKKQWVGLPVPLQTSLVSTVLLLGAILTTSPLLAISLVLLLYTGCLGCPVP